MIRSDFPQNATTIVMQESTADRANEVDESAQGVFGTNLMPLNHRKALAQCGKLTTDNYEPTVGDPWAWPFLPKTFTFLTAPALTSGELYIRVCEPNIPAEQANSLYVRVVHCGEQFQTTHYDTNFKQWNHEVILRVLPSQFTTPMQVQVWRHRTLLSDILVSEWLIDLSQVIKQPHTWTEYWTGASMSSGPTPAASQMTTSYGVTPGGPVSYPVGAPVPSYNQAAPPSYDQAMGVTPGGPQAGPAVHATAAGASAVWPSTAGGPSSPSTQHSTPKGTGVRFLMYFTPAQLDAPAKEGVKWRILPIPQFRVYLNKPIFYPGEVIEGFLVYNIISNTSCDVVAELHGEQSVHWMRGHGKNAHHFMNQFSLFKSEVYLHQRNVNAELKAGWHEFPIRFQLPNVTLPPSQCFRVTNRARNYRRSETRYYMHGEVKFSGLKPNIRLNTHFAIVPTYACPRIEEVAAAIMHLLPLNTDPTKLHITAQVSDPVLLPGQPLSVTLNVQNLTSSTFKKMVVCLTSASIMQAQSQWLKNKLFTEGEYFHFKYEESKGLPINSKETRTFQYTFIPPARLRTPTVPATISPITQHHYFIEVVFPRDGFFEHPIFYRIPLVVPPNYPDLLPALGWSVAYDLPPPPTFAVAPQLPAYYNANPEAPTGDVTPGEPGVTPDGNTPM